MSNLEYNSNMQVRTIKTHKITSEDKSLEVVLDKYLRSIPEQSILAVTSKIVAICEGRLV